MNQLIINSTPNCNRVFLLKNLVKNFIASNRYASGCFEDKTKCPKGKIMNTSCDDNKHEMPPRKAPKKEEFKSMWENPKCEPSAATCPQIGFDALYYKPSDKAKREYQQTWIECPARLVKPVITCEFPKDQYPPLERRARKERPDTAKCMDTSKLELAPCSRQKDLKQNKNCVKIKLPGCRGVRSDIRCKLVREPANCQIVRSPYPSYSECTHPKIKPKRVGECECMKIRSMCEVWTVLRQKAIL
ncbi:uncharacterized protein LOC129910637 [Episyrphus balteatus]|uniref:uncharacterized protein LOC129910637 n=1 Tax=Episyrphus balteatus TaxID=286459 RepID=UPI0024860E9B|nr:uncharacterized protein LOC129910637 [Episyrphus balteatus]